MTTPQGAPAQISEPIKIPDSGTPDHIINRCWGSSNEADEPRIRRPETAEPSYMPKSPQPPLQQSSQTMAAAPIPRFKKRKAIKAKSPKTLAREAAGLTLEKAAKKLCLAPSTLRLYERTRMPEMVIERACIVYGCHGNQLFFDAEYLNQLQAEQKGTAEPTQMLAAATGVDTSRRAGRRKFGLLKLV